ncbi:hypothetical protein MRX96_044500 [Rhipicephalus microplus]
MSKLQAAFKREDPKELVRYNIIDCLRCAMRRDRVCYETLAHPCKIRYHVREVRVFKEHYRSHLSGFRMRKSLALYRPLKRFFNAIREGQLVRDEYSDCSQLHAADPVQFDLFGFFVQFWMIQVVNSASVLDPGMPPPDLPQEILSSRSLSFVDMEALTSIVPDTTEPHQTMIIVNKMHSLPLHKAGLSEDTKKIRCNLTQPCLQTTHAFVFEEAHTLSRAATWLPMDVSFEKIQTPSQAEATDIENLSRTSPRAFPSQDNKSARDSSLEATSWTTSESSAVVLMPNHELRRNSFREMAQTSTRLPHRASRCNSVHQRRWDKHQHFQVTLRPC